MRKFVVYSWIFLTVSAIIGEKGFPASTEIPRDGGKAVLAKVNEEKITFAEFSRAFVSIHAEIDNTEKTRTSPTDLLNRMIDVRLILQEARNIGLDELQEFKEPVEGYKREILTRLLFSDHVRTVRNPDKKEVELRYREAVKEMKLKSVLVEKEEDGKKLESEVNAGGEFDDVVKNMVAEGLATGGDEPQYVRLSSLLPQVATVVKKMNKGEVSQLIRIGKRFTMVKLEDFRYAEDPAEWEKAEKDALQAKRVTSLKVYVESLKKRYVKIDQKLIDDLDYESPEPGFARMLEDQRVLARVQGENPVRVGDLTKALKQRYFHGIDRPIQEKKINRNKTQVMDDILSKKVVIKEARRKKMHLSQSYKDEVGKYEKDLLFGMFIQKLIDPDIRVDDAELKSYLDKNIREYTSPEMIRIESIAFSERKEAEENLEKLRRGADFQWVKENADRQVDPAKATNLLDFGNVPLITTILPEDVKKAVSGSSSGDYRLYADPEGSYYVLHIAEVIPPSPRSFESVREDLANRLIREKRETALKDWMAKLRAASKVEILASGKNLERIIRRQFR